MTQLDDQLLQENLTARHIGVTLATLRRRSNRKHYGEKSKVDRDWRPAVDECARSGDRRTTGLKTMFVVRRRSPDRAVWLTVGLPVTTLPA